MPRLFLFWQLGTIPSHGPKHRLQPRGELAHYLHINNYIQSITVLNISRNLKSQIRATYFQPYLKNCDPSATASRLTKQTKPPSTIKNVTTAPASHSQGTQ